MNVKVPPRAYPIAAVAKLKANDYIAYDCVNVRRKDNMATLTATDGYVLVTTTYDDQGEDYVARDYNLPRKSFEQTAKQSKNGFSVLGERRKEAHFPSVEQVIPSPTDKPVLSIVFNPKRLAQALQTVKRMLDDQEGDECIVRMDFYGPDKPVQIIADAGQTLAMVMPCTSSKVEHTRDWIWKGWQNSTPPVKPKAEARIELPFTSSPLPMLEGCTVPLPDLKFTFTVKEIT